MCNTKKLPNFDNRLKEMEAKISNIIDDINNYLKLDEHYNKLEAKFFHQSENVNMDSSAPPRTNAISPESVA